MLAIDPGSHLGGKFSGRFSRACSSAPEAAAFSFRLLLRSESNLNGVDTSRISNLTVNTFHMTIDRKRSTKEVVIPFPRIFHELATDRSIACDGASSKTCSAYLAVSWSSAMSILVKNDTLFPDRAWDTASRFVPQKIQNFRVPEFSLPQVGQNIPPPNFRTSSKFRLL